MRATWLQAVRREGLLSAYRGFGVAVASTAVYKGLYFGLYVSAGIAGALVAAPAGTRAMCLGRRMAGAERSAAALYTRLQPTARRRPLGDRRVGKAAFAM